MRLALVVAVLMLAFVAYTEAQEPTVEERFNQFGDKVKEMATNAAQTFSTAMENLGNNENVQRAKNWFDELIQKVKGGSS